MNTKWMLEEITDACRREFQFIIEDMASDGMNALSRLESSMLESALHFASTLVSKALQGLTCDEPSQAVCPHGSRSRLGQWRKPDGSRQRRGCLYEEESWTHEVRVLPLLRLADWQRFD